MNAWLRFFFFHIFLVCFVGGVARAQDTKSSPVKRESNTPVRLSARQRLFRNHTIQKHLTWEENGLSGRVKKMTEREYDKTGNASAPTVKTWTERVFSPGGYLTQFTEFSNAGTPERTTITLYDDKLNDTAEHTYSLPDHVLEFRLVFRKDKRGNETGAVSHNYGTDENDIHSGYKYDADDNLTEVDVYNEDRTVRTRTLFSYDKAGFKTGGATYDSANHFKGAYICKYDDQGNFQFSRTADSVGNTTGLDSAFYYPSGVLKKTVKYWLRNNVVHHKLLSRFDEHGRPTAVLYCEPDGRPIDSKSEYYENSYDSTGNLTHKKTYHMSDRKKVLAGYTEFIFEYY